MKEIESTTYKNHLYTPCGYMTIDAFVLILSYLDTLDESFIIDQMNIRFSKNCFNNIEWNKQLVKYLKEFHILEKNFENVEREIIFDIDDDVMRKLIIRDIGGYILVERNLDENSYVDRELYCHF